MYRNIYKKNKKYLIKKVIYGQNIDYGEYDTLNEALEQRNLLIKYNWIKNKSTKYPKREHFERYCVEENNQNKYIVKNRKDGKCYGAYKSKKYAKIIKKILTYQIEDIKIKEIEKKATNEFYKNITYNKLSGLYQITYKGITRASDKSLTFILSERDLILKYEGDEELMCENVNNIYEYGEDELPPFPKSINNISYEGNSKYKYKLKKQLRNHRIIIGQYSNYELAYLIKSYLENKKWKTNEIRHIQKVTKKIQERDKYIQKIDKKYRIIRKRKNQSITYGVYTDINLARYIRNRLNENEWNKELITDYKREYLLKKEYNEYFYDSTDYLSTG